MAHSHRPSSPAPSSAVFFFALLALGLAAGCEGCDGGLTPLVDAGQGPFEPDDAGGNGELPIGGDPNADAGLDDAGLDDDAGALLDGGVDGIDAGALEDAGVVVDAGPDGPCAFETLGAADRDRVILVSHTFTSTAGVPGTEVRGMTLQADGTIVDDNARFDVGFEVIRLAFAPSGGLAFALGEGGELASLAVDGAATLTRIDEVTLPSAAFGDVAVADDGRRLYVAGANSTETGGISVVDVACDGGLTLREDRFFPLRLAESIRIGPDGDRMFVMGGQALFEPMDLFDMRLLSIGDDGALVEIFAADIFEDFAGTARAGLSPDGRTAVVPNTSLFSSEGGEVSIVDLSGDEIVETQRFVGLSEVREARFSPDGETLLISRDIDNAVSVLRPADGGWMLTQTLTGIGLADQMALVTRGSQRGVVLLPAVNDVGNLRALRIEDDGTVTDLGRTDFGAGSEQIPYAVAVQP